MAGLRWLIGGHAVSCRTVRHCRQFASDLNAQYDLPFAGLALIHQTATLVIGS